MPIEDRLRSLLDAGDREDAVSLAKEALKNDRVEEVEFTRESVDVTTRHFVGTHDITGWKGEEVVVEKHGTYALRADDTFSFDTLGIYDNVLAAIQDAERTPESRVDGPA
jgi:hypothetical protein